MILHITSYYEWKKVFKKVIYFYIFLFFIIIISCEDNEEKPENKCKCYSQVIYEYDLEKKIYSLIKTFDVSSTPPYFSYFSNDNSKVIIAKDSKLYIINTKSKEEEIIDLDSLFVLHNFFSLSTVENKIVFSGFQSDILLYRRGLYLLDLDTKNIRILKSNNNRELPIIYYFPMFSNNGKLITYLQSEFSSYDSYKPDHSSISIYDLSTNIDEKIFWEDDDNYEIQYSMFDKTDENLVIIEFPLHLLKINLSNLSIDKIDYVHYFSGRDFLLNYPHFLITESKIFYTCETSYGYTKNHQIFKYDIESKKSNYFIDGIMPMSKNNSNGNILIRATCGYDDLKSMLEIISENGTITDTLISGERAFFSPDGDKVILLTPELATTSDYK